jgi:hypothetical protein
VWVFTLLVGDLAIAVGQLLGGGPTNLAEDAVAQVDRFHDSTNYFHKLLRSIVSFLNSYWT